MSLLWARVTLRRTALAEVRRRWGRDAKDPPLDPLTPGQLRRAIVLAATTMKVARRFPLHLTCLVQSLALIGMLSRRGIPAELKIGVRKDPEEGIAAHAWVECGGRVILDSEEHRSFVSLDRSFGSRNAP